MKEIKIIASIKNICKKIVKGMTQFIDKHLIKKNSYATLAFKEKMLEELEEEHKDEDVLEIELLHKEVEEEKLEGGYRPRLLTMTLDKLLALDFSENKGMISPLYRDNLLIKEDGDSRRKVIYLYPRAPTIRGLTKERICALHRYG